MKNTIYRSTEESRFRNKEMIAEKVSHKEAVEIVSAHIADDIGYDGLTQKRFEEERERLVAEVMSSGYLLFVNGKGVEIEYSIENVA